MPRVEISPDELRNNYEFKVAKRIVMDKFPWITDITIQEDELNEYNLIFLNIHVDPMKFMETYDVKPMSYIKMYNNSNYPASSLSVIFDMTYEDGREIVDGIDRTFQEVSNTPALPQELKMPEGRKLVAGMYHIPVTTDVVNLIRQSDSN